MMLRGRVFKESTGWSAHCEIIGVYTQGPSRKIATANLAEAVEMKAQRRGFQVTVTDLGSEARDVHTLLIDSSEPSVLAAEVLRFQRELHKLSLADVARMMGVSSRNAYASYEQGRREPSLRKFRELLAAVAPEMVVTIGPRLVPKKIRRKTP